MMAYKKRTVYSKVEYCLIDIETAFFENIYSSSLSTIIY
jgi:hypothetical protein